MHAVTVRCRARHFIVGLVVLGIATVGSLLQMPHAAALTGVTGGTSVSADSLPTVQIDGVVWEQRIAGSKVFAGGQFTNARPAGAAPGTNQVPRTNLLAYNLDTGVLDPSFAPTLNGRVKALALSPDGTTIYVGGAFTQVNGQARSRVAAFNVATGALLPWAPAVNSEVNALVATGSAVFIGGQFSRVGSVSRASLAAVHPTSGALLAWAPVADGIVQGLAIVKDESRIVVAGNFATLNGVSNRGLGAVTVADGAALPFPINQIIQNSGTSQSFLGLQIDEDDNVYGTGWAWAGQGPFLEGVFAADAMTGNVRWLADCHGDSYDATRVGDTVYAVSHHHTCANINAFPETSPRTHHHSDAFTVNATGTVNHNNQGGYPDFHGNPAPTMVQWFPDAGVGRFTGQSQAGWTLTGNDKYLLMGGEFPTINGVGQQGLARFAVRSSAPKKVGPRGYPSTLAPKLFQTSPNSVRIAVPGTWDQDDLTLTYVVERQGKAKPVATLTSDSTFWQISDLHADDTEVVPGNTYRYRVKISDPDGNTLTTYYTSITTSADVPAYPAGIFADGADHYWQLGAASPFADLAGEMPLTTAGTVTTEAAGAFTGSAASRFDGATGTAGGSAMVAGPQTFSVEAWFKTTTTSGGKIVGFGNSSTGTSGNYDRHIYMTNSGQLTFGVYAGSTKTVTSPKSYNDGEWHHAVGTLSAAGLVFYVDGLKVGSDAGTTSAQDFAGVWRVGADNLSGWPNRPTSDFFAGTIDDVAVYPSALSVAQIRAHYTATGRTVDVPPSPTDAYGKAVFDDEPYLQWRLNETSGTTAFDTSPDDTNGTVSGGVTWGATSPVAPGTGVSLNGSDGLIATTEPVSSPQVYSTEIWFNTTTTAGGKLIGFGNQPIGPSANYDRHIYMSPEGNLHFGIWDGSMYTISTPGTYNDGQWHHAVGTQGPDGIKFYVDGQLIGTDAHNFAHTYNGYWRVGGDNTWLGAPYFNGTVDEVAVYGQELSLTQVRTHYRASAAAANTAPTASIESACTENTCSFTATASDPDGTIARYAWDFGDGATAEGATARHTYAQGGSYTVTLTVTDDQGGTKAVTAEVTAADPPPNQNPTAAFTVTKDALKVTVDGTTSSDPDGTITTYAWAFGDGSQATGAEATHTYAAAGTYTITLKVTDNRGGTNTTSSSVSVSALVVSDNFTRTTTSGWGTADVGGQWTHSTSTLFSTNGSQAVVTLPQPRSNGGAYLTGVTVQDLDATVQFTPMTTPTGSGVQTTLLVRRISSTTDYRVTYQLYSDGRYRLNITKRVNGAAESLGTILVPAFTAGAGDTVNLRLRVTGTSPTTIQAKVWKAGTTEPAAFQMTRTDSQAQLQTAGSFGFVYYLSGNETAPTSLRMDNLRIERL